MRRLRRMLWAGAVVVAMGQSSALAQQQGGFGTGGSGTGGNIGSTTTQFQTLPTTTTQSTQSSSTTSTGSGLPGASSSISGNMEQQPQFELAEVLLAPSRTTTNNTAINTSNFLRNTYGSVYYQGADRSQVPNRIPGSFGTAIYPATGTGTTGGRGGAAGTTTFGGRGTGGGGLTDPGGQIVALPRQIAYASQIQFKMPAGNAVPQLQADLRGAIDRVPTSMLTNPTGVQVNVDGRNVTLKGVVRDEEEARLVEGLVRLTPGVFGIKNELTIAK